MATPPLPVSPTSNLRSGPAALHCDCSAPPRSHIPSEDEAGGRSSESPGVRLQLQSMEKYALEKVPSPVRIKPGEKTLESSSSDISPPPSPKRKREADLQKDMKDVAFTAVLPSKNVDLHRSQSTF